MKKVEKIHFSLIIVDVILGIVISNNIWLFAVVAPLYLVIVILIDVKFCPNHEVKLIKRLREEYDYSLKKAKEIVDNANSCQIEEQLVISIQKIENEFFGICVSEEILVSSPDLETLIPLIEQELVPRKDTEYLKVLLTYEELLIQGDSVIEVGESFTKKFNEAEE